MNSKAKIACVPLALAAKHPPYCDLSIADAYTRFCAELAERELCDPRGKKVVVHELNFPKLLGMKRADPKSGALILDPNTGKPVKAKASRVVEQLKNGTFQENAYYVERGRIRTLFWIPDVIQNPDSIHPNAHAVVVGDEVYVKRYLKLGQELKIVVMGPASGGQRVIITSFMTHELALGKYVGNPPVWTKK